MSQGVRVQPTRETAGHSLGLQEQDETDNGVVGNAIAPVPRPDVPPGLLDDSVDEAPANKRHRQLLLDRVAEWRQGALREDENGTGFPGVGHPYAASVSALAVRRVLTRC